MAVFRRSTEPAVAGDAAAAPADEQTARPTRRTWFRRRRTAGPGPGAAVAAAGAGTALLIARVIRAIAGVVALIIALGVLFVVLKASPSNTIVSHVHDWARWLVGSFDGMFHLHSARGTVALNWGIALVVYLLVGSLIARIVLTPARVLRRRARV
jgi:hypothetical protein